jgi:transcriptional regulator with XRE-family HTH domain
MKAGKDWKCVSNDSFDRNSPKQIEYRLRYMRMRVLLLSQNELASACLISRDVYANYESGRTVLPCLMALRICSRMIISERWLATGEGSPRPCVNLQHYGIPQAIEEAPFHLCFEKHLSSRFEKLNSRPFRAIVDDILSIDPDPITLQNLHHFLKTCVALMCQPDIAIGAENDLLMRESHFFNALLSTRDKDPRKKKAYRFDPETGGMSKVEMSRLSDVSSAYWKKLDELYNGEA